MPISDFAKLSADALRKLKQELDVFLESTGKGHLEMDQDDAVVIRDMLAFRSCSEETYVIVVAMNRDPRKNTPTRIKCHRGTPLGGYAYDTVNDSYCFDCVDHLALGLVPISFQIVLGKWASYVPMPEQVMAKYLSEKQQANLKAYRANFTPAEDYIFEFVQLLH